MRPTFAALTLALFPLAALAQERPSEGDIFGETPQTGQAPREPALPQLKEDPLKIGGQIYLRAQGQWQQDVPPADWTLAAPALVDGFMDVRPNDRVRGFLLTRLQYDLSRSTSSQSSALATGGSNLGTVFGGGENPKMLLDQLWVNFDIQHTIFVTAGKQHVKWGTGHFWNPTDFLHPVPRDPLAAFDARTGQTMVKLHLPWEKRGWNFYGMAVFDESQSSGLLGNLGAGARAEVVFGTVEIGVDGLLQRGKDARMGIDFSAGIWNFDVYGEAALKNGSDIPLWRARAQPTTPLPPSPTMRDFYETYQPGFAPQVVGGLSWSWKYNDEDTLTLGAEYFYNGAGYIGSGLYPVALAGQVLDQRTYFNSFYLSEHYLGVYLLLPKPGAWNDTTFTLSTIGNLSDHTYVTRLDYSVLLLTYLTLEAYGAVHYGARGGEFRLGLDVPQVTVNGTTYGPFHVAPPVLDFGIALRVNL
jgi:hypothetical protein